MMDYDGYDAPMHRFDPNPFINPESVSKAAERIRNGEDPAPRGNALKNAIFAVALACMADRDGLPTMRKLLGLNPEAKKGNSQ